MTTTAKTIPDPSKQRRRGALSCAECRRLKLRCDRQFPCQSCRKRGCAAICPDGALTTGKGNRFILANTEELHERIEELQERIVHLEGGLQALYQKTNSGERSEPHPLLTDELLNIKTPIGAEIVGSANPRLRRLTRSPDTTVASAGVGEGDNSEELTESFGTLALADDSGKSRFFGTAAGAQFLLGEQDSDEDRKPNIEDENQPSHGRPRTHERTSIARGPLAHLAHTYPFSIRGSDWPAASDILRTYLPDPNTAWSLSEQYYEHGAWLYDPVSRAYFVEQIFTPILDPLYDPAKPKPTPADYALLFIVLALGAILDLSRPPYVPEAEHYHALSRAAMGVEDPPADSLTNVQAMMLMCYYNQLSDDKRAPARVWSLSGLAYKMATAIGLHRDGKRWNLGEEEADRRRRVFWELAMFDAWSSQGLGRPPTILTVHVDAAFPTDYPEHVDANGNPDITFQKTKYSYATTITEILNEVFSAKRPTYEAILRLDRTLRDLEIPYHLQIPGLSLPPGTPQPPPSTSLGQIMQAHTTFCIKETSLIYLHRGYLARALAQHPDDPFKSRYAASVLAAHKSSCMVLAGVRHGFALLPRLMPRVFFLWVHAFSAAIVLATIVIRAPSSKLVASSFSELDMACDLFERAKEGCRPARVLPVLLKLRQKAHLAFEEHQQGKPRFLSPVSETAEDAQEDDLTMLGGKSRLLRVKGRTSATPSTMPSAPSPPSLTSFDDNSSMEDDSPKPAPSEYHPALAEYLKMYNQQYDRAQNVPTSTTSSLARQTNALELSSTNVAQLPTGNVSLDQTPYDFSFTYGLPGSSQDDGGSSSSQKFPSSPGLDPQFYAQIPPVQQQQVTRMKQMHPQQQQQPEAPQLQQNHQRSPQLQQSPQQRPQYQIQNQSQGHIAPPQPLLQSPPPQQSPQQLQQQQQQQQQQQYNVFNPQTPFSAFEPAFAIPRRDRRPSDGSPSAGASVCLPTSAGVNPMTQFAGIDASLTQSPETMDLGWQFMSDLRPYL